MKYVIGAAISYFLLRYLASCTEAESGISVKENMHTHFTDISTKNTPETQEILAQKVASVSPTYFEKFVADVSNIKNQIYDVIGDIAQLITTEISFAMVSRVLLASLFCAIFYIWFRNK